MNILEQSIELYKSGLSMPKVRNITGISYWTLHPALKKLGLNRSCRTAATKYTVDHTYFNKINTESKAYWLGFIYADGFITTSKYSKYFGVSLSEHDEDHLEKLKNAMQATNPLKHYINNSWGIKIKYVRLLII
jgi:DNA-binding transcriptional regulator WhiA